MTRITEKIDNTTVNTSIEQDRLALSDDDRTGRLYIKQKLVSKPLGSNETVVTLKATSENSDVRIAVDSRQLDGLMDALHDIREDYKDD